MTRVDFYILKDANSQRRNITACRLAEKAYSQGLHVYLQVASNAHAKDMDNLLWSFRDRSFVPHGINDNTVPVQINYGDSAPDGTQYDVLINLAPAVPDHFSRFDRVLEIINDEKTIKQSGRERFRFYRDRGYALETHEL